MVRFIHRSCYLYSSIGPRGWFAGDLILCPRLTPGFALRSARLCVRRFPELRAIPPYPGAADGIAHRWWHRAESHTAAFLAPWLTRAAMHATSRGGRP